MLRANSLTLELPVTLALFDLDNTLIAGDSDHLWGEFLISRQLVDKDHYRQQNDNFYRDYQNASLDIDAYLRFAINPLTQHSADFLAELHREFMQTCIEPIILPKALALLQEHRERGHKLLIITATNAFITRPIARHLGVETLLATEPALEGGRYTGEYLGTPCYAEGKVINLQHWLDEQRQTLNGSYFYSDSINDLPLLEQVQFPIAVNPDQRLDAIAKARNWPILDLRSP
ncbi:MAG TPA: HAD family hydrolase [Cellvibrionaceae bacterium]